MAKPTADALAAEMREEWLEAVEKLLSQIQTWADQLGWPAARMEPKEMMESAVGTYAVSDLRIRAPAGILTVDVVARNVVSAEGRVDLVAFPSLHNMMLIRTAGRWIVKTDAGMEWPRKWGKRTFVELAKTLTTAP